jgi:Ninjurin.
VQVVSSILAILLARLNINTPERQHMAAILNRIVPGFVLVSMTTNIIKMSFGLDAGPQRNRTTDENA